MARIAGIKYNKTTGGKVKSVTIDLKKWGEYFEDFLDMIEVERIKNSPDGKIFYDWGKLKTEMAKRKAKKK